MTKYLEFKAPTDTVWHRVASPSGLYGRYGSLEAYEMELRRRGRQTRVVTGPEAPLCKCCNGTGREPLPKG